MTTKNLGRVVGESAYEVWLNAGNTGSVDDFLASLKSTLDYEQLENQPSINNTKLSGNKSLDDLNIQEKGSYANSRITNTELEQLFSDWK